MDITILTDNKNSWIIPYVEILKKQLSLNHNVSHIYKSENISKGDLLIILSCENLISKNGLSLNTNNIVVHPSELPKGRGWSPLAWQVLEGQNKIPITLFEANENLDSGEVYLVDYIELSGYELNDEIKKKQGEKTLQMVKYFINNIDGIASYPQRGKESFYSRRTKEDSELDISKTLDEQFNLLRVVDNARYPAYFVKDNKKYLMKIYEDVMEPVDE